MRTRSVAALLLLAVLLLSLPALAGDAPRRVTTVAGEVVEGLVVERSSDHIVLQLSDGRLIELLQAQIATIEVLAGLGEVGPSPGDEVWDEDPLPAPRRGRFVPALSDETESGQPGVHLDGLDRVQLQDRLKLAQAANAWSVAAWAPSLSGGFHLMASSPGTAGTYYWPVQFVVGMALVSGSVVTSAAGAHQASLAAGMTEVSPRFRAGLVVGATGAGLASIPLGLAYGVYTGFLPSPWGYSGGVEQVALAFVVGSGLGLLIAGDVILAADGAASGQAIEDRLKDGLVGERRRIRPQFAGLSFGPGLDGGLHAGFAMRF
jgi:hypothetical protein